MREIVKLEKFGKKYNDRTIFENFNLDILQQQYIMITGPSGKGKSTLLNVIGLLDDDYFGLVQWNNSDVKKMHDLQKSIIRNTQIGFVFQNYNLIDELNVFDNIMMPFCYSRKKINQKHKEELAEITKELQIDSLLNAKVKYLSGGEKQRVAIARAVILNPLLILADEPTGNLDEYNSEIVLNYFDRLREKQSIVLVTHDLSILHRADKVISL